MPVNQFASPDEAFSCFLRQAGRWRSALQILEPSPCTSVTFHSARDSELAGWKPWLGSSESLRSLAYMVACLNRDFASTYFRTSSSGPTEPIHQTSSIALSVFLKLPLPHQDHACTRREFVVGMGAASAALLVPPEPHVRRANFWRSASALKVFCRSSGLVVCRAAGSGCFVAAAGFGNECCTWLCLVEPFIRHGSQSSPADEAES